MRDALRTYRTFAGIVSRIACAVVITAGMAVDGRAQATSWNGSVSSSWHDPTNWSSGVPGSTSTVLVSAGAPGSFDIILTQPIGGDTACTGPLTLQNSGHIRLDPEPAPGALIVHGKTQILNGGGIFVRSGRVEFRDDVRVNNGGVLNCGSGTVLFRGRKFEVANGGVFVVDGSTLATEAAASTSIEGDVQLAKLRVRNRDTLFIHNNVHVVEELEIDSGRTVFVRTTGLLTVDGAITGAGSIVYESALPVQLSAWSAAITPGGVMLRWTTATEVDNAGWEVERRRIVDVRLTSDDWKKIGFVDGSGTSSSSQEYVFFDHPQFDNRHSALDKSTRFAYRLKQIDRSGSFSYSHEAEIEIGLPGETTLEPNFPNPFNPSTVFRFHTPVAGEARLVIHDLLGRSVAEVFRGPVMAGGSVQVAWRASGLASGTYLARLSVGTISISRRIVLAR